MIFYQLSPVYVVKIMSGYIDLFFVVVSLFFRIKRLKGGHEVACPNINITFNDSIKIVNSDVF